MEDERSFLLDSSYIFNDSTYLDRIRQSFIDLQVNPEKLEVQELLEEQIIPFLEKDITEDAVSEIFLVVMTCFQKFFSDLLPIFDQFFSKSRSNSNFVIITASILELLIENKIDFKPDYNSFVLEALSQILPQIQSTDKNTFQVFNHEIPAQFKFELIVNLVIASPLTKELVSDFTPYIFSQKTIQIKPKIIYLIDKITDLNLLSNLPQSISFETEFFEDLNEKIYTSIIPLLSEKTFKEVQPLIDESIQQNNPKTKQFSLAYLQKCCKYNLKIATASILIRHFSFNEITPEIWAYLKQFNFILPLSTAVDFHDFKDSDYLLRIYPDLNYLPSAELTKYILECENFKTYESILFIRNFNHEIFKTQQFWNHIVAISSHEECPKQLVPKFVHLFKTFFDIDSFTDVLDEMIMSNYPLNEKEISFVSIFLVTLRPKYREVFTEEEHMKELLSRIIQKDCVPLPRFWELITFNAIIQKLRYESNPLLLYGYEFARGKHYSDETLPPNFYFMKQTDSSKEELTQFIQQNNIKYIVNMHNEALSFISIAFIFTSMKAKVKVSMLTKKDILPFFAIGFNYLNKCKGNLNFSFPEYSTMLQESFKELENNESPLSIASIDAILSHPSELSNPEIFPNSIFLKLINILTSFVIKDQYKANKMIYLLAIFNFSSNEKVKSIFEKCGNEIFNYIIKNMNEIVTSDKFGNNKLNLAVFDNELVISTAVNIIQNSSAKDSRNMIYFLEKMCTNVPQMSFTKPDFYANLANEAYKVKNWEDVVIFDQFKEKNHIVLYNKNEDISQTNIPLEVQIKLKTKVSLDKLNIDELLSLILNDPQPEKNNQYFQILFDFMMKDKTISTYYISILLQHFYTIECLNPKTILTFFSEEYNTYKSSFFDAIQNIYLYDPKSKTFIKKPDFEFTNPLPKLGLKIISMLFKAISEKENNYQAFYCLRVIANSFSFLFNENPQQVFDCVLPVLNDLPLLIKSENENEIDKIKTVVSALSFLLFALTSPIILDAFCNWFFDKLNEFSPSQILGFIFVIRSILGKAHFTIYLKKFNFIDHFVQILQRQIPVEIEGVFRSNVYELISEYFNSITTLTKIRCIMLDAYDAKNQFFTVFDHCLVHLPSTCQPTCFIPSWKPIEAISKYVKSVDEIKPFYFTNDYRKNKKTSITNDQINDFVSVCKKNIISLIDPNFPPLPLPPIPQNLPLQIMYKIARKRQWIVLYILCHYNLTLLPEHYNVLTRVIGKINKEVEQLHKRDNVNEKEIKVNNADLYSNNELIKIIIMNYNSLSHLFNKILMNETGMIHIYESIDEILNDNITVERLDYLLSMYEKSNNQDFKYSFFKKFSEKILDISLRPQFRKHKDILLKVAQFFVKNSDDLPIKITQLIDFMLLLNVSKYLLPALQLCKRIGIQNLGNVMELLETRFEEIVDSGLESINAIQIFMTTFPEIISSHQSMIYNFMVKTFENYFETRNGDSFELFTLLINKIAPKNDSSISNVMSDSVIYNSEIPIQDQEFPVISSLLKDQSNFWKYYEVIQPKFMEIVRNDLNLFDSFSFLKEFPQVIDLQTRSKYFLSKVKRSINYDSTLYVVADRMDIVESSFEALKLCQAEDFKRRLHVTFIGEEIATDMGGVTVNWLYLLSQQLFNPANGLFDSFSTNGGYKPSVKSKQKNNYLEYFKFAGRIIARSLMQNIAVDAHMAPFFYKCILHRPIKLADLRELDEKQYESLTWILENSIEENGLELFFEIGIEDSDGKNVSVELIENGSNVQVTDDNKEDYVNAAAEYYLKGAIKEQCDAFCEGFDSLIPHDQINIFTQGEMDLLICGISEFSDEDFRRLVICDPPYTHESQTVKCFFNVVSRWSKEDRAKLLLFITSTSKFPVNVNKSNQILLSYRPNVEYLPVAHTCFRQLDLPDYKSEDILNEKLLFAVRNCSSFALS